jgi:SAM-dependent methyltransferase
MAMNLAHRLLCSSDKWAAKVESDLLPWVLDGVQMGDNVLEIGPGYGANIRVLIDRVPHYTAVELDTLMAQRLDKLYGDRARIINGDGTDTGLPADEFSSVVCFTMLHHIPTADLQDRLFAEAFRVLRPGGVFAGSDSLSSLRFRLLHLRDVCNPATPQMLTTRLCAAGFVGVHVDTSNDRQRWRAAKAGR